MLFDAMFQSDMNPDRIKRLENAHLGRYSLVVWLLLVALVSFSIWASVFEIDQVARGAGEVIPSSRVQLIQAVDGGVLSELNVQEGDRVKVGQVIARLDQRRIQAAVREIEARLSALKAKQARLRGEVTGVSSLEFPPETRAYPEIIRVESALFEQRRAGFNDDLANLREAVDLAKDEVELVRELARSGDANRSEEIRVLLALNDVKSKLSARRNGYFEEVGSDLTKVEDEIAQNEQILAQRRQQMADSVFTAMVPGIVKNIRVTTVGGVLQAGEELMQIVPLDDQLILEAKVAPVDIAQVRPGLSASIRFDSFDYTLYGSVDGKVVYVSADTLKEATAKGEDIYYRVHVLANTMPVTTTSGRALDILPGMTAQVDIQTGHRTLMDYLLKPLRRTLSESLGEQ